MYATETLTSEQIAATGFAVRDVYPTPSVPISVTDLNATPYANGEVTLNWERGNNPKATTFMVEKSTDLTNWTTAGVTTRSKIKLTGFNPGEQVWFRVVSTKNEVYSTPSLTAVIYPVETPSTLSLAA